MWKNSNNNNNNNNKEKLKEEKKEIIKEGKKSKFVTNQNIFWTAITSLSFET